MQEVELFQPEKLRFFLRTHLHRRRGNKRIKEGNVSQEKQILQRRVCFCVVQGRLKAHKTIVIMPKSVISKIGNTASSAV